MQRSYQVLYLSFFFFVTSNMSKKEGGLQFEGLQKIPKQPKITTKPKNPTPTEA